MPLPHVTGEPSEEAAEIAESERANRAGVETPA
jgi:hypothetical protein